MAYVKKYRNMIGKVVELTENKMAMSGGFESGSIVIITAVDQMRGYTFEDKEGNRVIEAGFTGFKEIVK